MCADTLRRLMKLFPHFARVRSLSIVNPHVDVQTATLSETFATYCTRVVLLACVDLHVSQQMATLPEAVSTQFTGIRFLARVDRRVPFER